MSLDELVKDIDVQDIRDKNQTDEMVKAMHIGYEKSKNTLNTIGKALCILRLVLLGIALLALLLRMLFSAG